MFCHFVNYRPYTVGTMSIMEDPRLTFVSNNGKIFFAEVLKFPAANIEELAENLHMNVAFHINLA